MIGWTIDDAIAARAEKGRVTLRVFCELCSGRRDPLGEVRASSRGDVFSALHPQPVSGHVIARQRQMRTDRGTAPRFIGARGLSVHLLDGAPVDVDEQPAVHCPTHGRIEIPSHVLRNGSRSAHGSVRVRPTEAL